MEEILHQYPMIYWVLAPSQVVVWDFGTINKVGKWLEGTRMSISRTETGKSQTKQDASKPTSCTSNWAFKDGCLLARQKTRH